MRGVLIESLMDEVPLPAARVESIIGLLEILIEQEERVDIFRLGRRLRLPIDDLIPIIEAARMLGFVGLVDGDVALTETGREFAGADIYSRKEIFRRQVLLVPLVREVMGLVAKAPRRRLARAWLIRWLERSISELWASRTFEILVNWGRYAEIIGYSARTGELYLMTSCSAVSR